MATETAVLDRSTEGGVEKKESETTENIQQEIVPRSKENGNEVKVEMAGSPSEVAAAIQPEEKTQEDKVDIHVVVQEKKVEEAVDKTPISDVSVNEGPEVVDDSKDTPASSALSAVPEKASELEEKEYEEPSETMDITEQWNMAEKPNEQTGVPPLEPEPKVDKESEVQESITEAAREPVERLETSDVETPAPEAGIVAEQKPEISVASKSVSEVEENPDKQSTVSVVADTRVVEKEKPVEHLEISDVTLSEQVRNRTEEKLTKKSGESGVADISEVVKKPEERLGTSDVAIPAPAAENVAEEQLDAPVSKTLPEDEGSKETPASVPKELVSDAVGEDENKSKMRDSNQSVEAEVTKDDGTSVEIKSLKEELITVKNVSIAAEEEKLKEDVGGSAVPNIGDMAATESNKSVNDDDTKKGESNVDLVEQALEEATVKEVDKVDTATGAAKHAEKADEKVVEHKEEKIEKIEYPSLETISTKDVATVKAIEKVDSATELSESSVKKEDNVEEERAEKSGKIEETAPVETTKIDDVGGSDSADLVDGSSSGVEKTAKDAEIIVDERKKEEIVKEEIPTSLEATKEQEVGGTDMIDTKEQGLEEQADPVGGTDVTDTKEQGLEEQADPVGGTDVIDTKKRGLEEQAEHQPVPSGGDEVEKAEEKAQMVDKSDIQKAVQPTKDGDPKVDGDMTKQGVPAKQKQSNNLMSKVKHSIGKVKKAIIGKSPSSKTISVSADTKGDANVK